MGPEDGRSLLKVGISSCSWQHLKFIRHTVAKRPRTKEAATGTGLGTDISGFGASLSPGIPEPPASILFPALVRLRELPIPQCPENHLLPATWLAHCVIMSPTVLMHPMHTQADGNEAGSGWWHL